MRRALLCLLLSGLVVPALAAGPDVYYVVLRDGAWVRAAEKPTVEEGVAQIRLPNGLMAEVEAERIDWKSSDARSRHMRTASLFDAGEPQAMPQPREAIPGTLTIVNPPGAGPMATTGGPAPGTASPPAAGTTSDPAASVRARINTLDAGIQELQQRRRDLQQQAAGAYNLDDAARLRDQAAQIDTQIKTLREEKERLLRQLWNLQQP